jgi:dihydrofolate synthase / folylpolyglutamate synthase
MEYLGDTREKIGFEKAGVFRPNTPAICGDENPPQSVLNHAKQIGAHLALINRDFFFKKTPQGWQYSADNVCFTMPNLGLAGNFQGNNAACVLHAVQHFQVLLPASQANINAGLANVKLNGRFQQVHENPQIIVDVAHNPQAAKSLADNLQTMPCAGKTLAVFAMLADKDISGVVSAVKSQIDAWYLADIHAARGEKAQELDKILKLQGVQSPTLRFTNVTDALAAACKDADKNDRIIVFGSFYTVADAIAVNQRET